MLCHLHSVGCGTEQHPCADTNSHAHGLYLVLAYMELQWLLTPIPTRACTYSMHAHLLSRPVLCSARREKYRSDLPHFPEPGFHKPLDTAHVHTYPPVLPSSELFPITVFPFFLSRNLRIHLASLASVLMLFLNGQHAFGFSLCLRHQPVGSLPIHHSRLASDSCYGLTLGIACA